MNSDNLVVPDHILEAAETIGNWAAENGLREWEIGPVASRHGYNYTCAKNYALTEFIKGAADSADRMLGPGSGNPFRNALITIDNELGQRYGK